MPNKVPSIESSRSAARTIIKDWFCDIKSDWHRQLCENAVARIIDLVVAHELQTPLPPPQARTPDAEMTKSEHVPKFSIKIEAGESLLSVLTLPGKYFRVYQNGTLLTLTKDSNAVFDLLRKFLAAPEPNYVANSGKLAGISDRVDLTKNSSLSRAESAPQEAGTQHTICAVCLIDKPTPLRIDWMGGYVCLTCINEELEQPPEPGIDAGKLAEGIYEGMLKAEYIANEPADAAKVKAMNRVARAIVIERLVQIIGRLHPVEIKPKFTKIYSGSAILTSKENLEKFGTEAAEPRRDEREAAMDAIERVIEMADSYKTASQMTLADARNALKYFRGSAAPLKQTPTSLIAGARLRHTEKISELNNLNENLLRALREIEKLSRAYACNQVGLDILKIAESALASLPQPSAGQTEGK